MNEPAEYTNLPYTQVQGVTGARIYGVWFDRRVISVEIWAHVSQEKFRGEWLTCGDHQTYDKRTNG